MLGFMASWFTPTVLFVVLNVVIGTIFITSNFKAHNKPHQQQQPQNTDDELNPTQLVRVPSLLERVRSIDFSFYRSENPNQQPEDRDHSQPQLVRTPSLLERVRSFNFSLSRSERPDPLQPDTHLAGDPPHEEPEPQSHEIHVTRSKSDRSGDAPPKREAVPERMAKSASENSSMAAAAAEDEEEVVQRRPASVRDGKQTTSFWEDDGVDAKADDFINRFKQHLKLQRLDSLLRFREMLNRGSSE